MPVTEVARPVEIERGVAAFAARTPTLPPATHTNSYALGEREVLLVEPATPYGDEQRAWLDWARGIASTGRRIVGIFVTHEHQDHVGGAEVLARELDLPLLAHDATAARIDVPVARRLDEGDELVLDGPTPMRFRVFHTPGHAKGHLCLLSDEGVAVVGDMVASQGTILVPPGDDAMATYLRQLERMCGWGARVALPAHGGPIPAPAELFRHYVQHRLMREAKVLAAFAGFAAAGATLDEALPRAYDDAPAAALPWARISLDAHVEKLVSDGKLTLEGERWVAR